MRAWKRTGVAAVMALTATMMAAGAGSAPEAPGVDHDRIRHDRITKLLPEILQAQGIDLWLTFTRENATDPMLTVLGVDHIVARGAFLFAWKDGKFRRIAIAASYDVDPIHASGLYDEVIAYRSEGVKPHLKKVVEDLAPGTVALNFSRDVTIADGLTVGMRNYLEETLGERQYVSSERLVVSLMGRKLPEEIAALEKAVSGTDRIIREALTPAHVQPGVTTEQDLDQWMRGRAAEGGFGVAFGSVVVGPQRGHSSPTDRVIQRGDIIRIDWGVSWGGYCADVQRMAYVLREGEKAAPGWLVKMFEATRDANAAAVAALRPGNTGNDVDRAGREALISAGYPEYPHGTGHAIGLKVHDVGPMLGPDWRERYGDPVFFPIEVDQVFAVEPLIYMQPEALEYEINTSLEEDVLVGKDGTRYLTPPQKELIVIATP